jgi:hypothetical protein
MAHPNPITAAEVIRFRDALATLKDAEDPFEDFVLGANPDEPIGANK